MTLTKQQIYGLAVINETDLYNTETGYYISGSVIHEDEEREELIVYLLYEGEANELAELSKGECWLGYLGPGGNIYDDPWEWIDTDSCTETGWIECKEVNANG